MNVQDLRPALAMMDAAGAAALAAPGPEAAIRAITRAYYDLLGDREAHLRPDALKPGERQFFVAGAFFVTPDLRYHMLVGNVNFPPEQERLMVPIDGGHPGWVYANRSKLILKNTDEHTAFRQDPEVVAHGFDDFRAIVLARPIHGPNHHGGAGAPYHARRGSRGAGRVLPHRRRSLGGA